MRAARDGVQQALSRETADPRERSVDRGQGRFAFLVGVPGVGAGDTVAEGAFDPGQCGVA
jgi:hypothetical protein